MTVIKKIGAILLNMIVLAILCALFFFKELSSCNTSNVHIVDTVITNIITIDSTEHTVKVPQIIRKTDTVYYPVPANTDTAAILAYFFSSGVFITETRDTNIVITSIDTVRENALVGKSISYKILRPCTSTETTITKQAPAKNKLYAGIGSGFGGGAQLNGSILLVNKKDQGLSLTNNLIGKQPNFSLIAYFNF